jgi:cystathionine beta-synthase
MTPEYCATALEAIGETPLVRLRRVIDGARPLVLAKLEYLNPGASAKDRIALAMIEHAERAGFLRPGGTIVEPSSGNTGAALAMVAAIRGYRCILVVPEKTSSEKIATMRAYGAEVVVAPPVSAGSSDAYTAIARRLSREIPGAYMPDQYSNPVNPLAHERTTGPEIWQQTAGTVTHVVAGVGTGGTICGISRALKAHNQKVEIVGVDPIGSIYSGGMPEPYAVEGIGRHYIPQSLDLGAIDRIERVGDREAFEAARRAGREEGLLVGGSSGAALVAAARVAREHDQHATIVVVLPDSGQAYISKFFNDDWLTSHGFAGLRARTLADVIEQLGIADTIFLDSSCTLGAAHLRMSQESADDLALVDDDCHVGRVSLNAVFQAFHDARARLDVKLADIMGPPFPLLDGSACIDDAARVLRAGESQVVVTRRGRPVAALRARELIRYASLKRPA